MQLLHLFPFHFVLPVQSNSYNLYIFQHAKKFIDDLCQLRAEVLEQFFICNCECPIDVKDLISDEVRFIWFFLGQRRFGVHILILKVCLIIVQFSVKKSKNRFFEYGYDKCIKYDFFFKINRLADVLNFCEQKCPNIEHLSWHYNSMRRRNIIARLSIVNPIKIFILLIILTVLIEQCKLFCKAELISTLIQPQNANSSILGIASQKQVPLVKVKSMGAIQVNSSQDQQSANKNLNAYDTIETISSKNSIFVPFKYQSSNNLPNYGGVILLDLSKDNFYANKIEGKPSNKIQDSSVVNIDSTNNSKNIMQFQQKSNNTSNNSMMNSQQANIFSTAMQGSQKNIEKMFQNFR